HARFLSNLQTIDFSIIYVTDDVQLAFDKFYILMNSLLKEYYPCRQVTVTSRDPPFVTPHVKLMLREKNRLVRRGQIPQADALARCIGEEITKFNSASLSG